VVEYCSLREAVTRSKVANRQCSEES
jgi:hypothetical protein